jgi:hypothetical protein
VHRYDSAANRAFPHATELCTPRGSTRAEAAETADARRRHLEAELVNLATAPPIAPARILARERQHQLPALQPEAAISRAVRTAAAPSGAQAPDANEAVSVGDYTRALREVRRQVAGGGCEQGRDSNARRVRKLGRSGFPGRSQPVGFRNPVRGLTGQLGW